MQSSDAAVVILGTGGTIAGKAAVAADNVGYVAAQLTVAELLADIPALAAGTIECEQVAQLDSKDMSHAVWQRLAQRCAHHLARPEVAGIVVTHGTDTLEETAWFLQRVLAPGKPVVLTAAMRPATALHRDGPQNLLDAVTTAHQPGARGVVAVMAGRILGARDVRKTHPYRIDAFDSGNAGPIAVVEEGHLRLFRAWPEDAAIGGQAIAIPTAQWPRVEIVFNHAGATGDVVRALVDAGVRGIAVAATGNGTLHTDLEAALIEVQQRGVAVLVSTRCGDGRVLPQAGQVIATADDLTPVKARVELLLRLLSQSVAGLPPPANF
jgi:L-asparaginase